LVDDHLEVPYAKATVKDAPKVDVDAGGFLSVDEEHRLYEHYGIAWDEDRGWQQVVNQPDQGGGASTDSRTVIDATESAFRPTTTPPLRASPAAAKRIPTPSLHAPTVPKSAPR
jgi:hypothetical protein